MVNYVLISEWNRFVHKSIQLWEDFYLNWINKGNQILIIHYEHLKNASDLKKTLSDVCEFLNFKFDEDRFNCLARHPFTLFQRNKGCMKNITKNVDIKDRRFYIYKQTSVFQTKHNLRIDFAIEKINDAAERRGLPGISNDYKNTTVPFNVCKQAHQAIK